MAEASQRRGLATTGANWHLRVRQTELGREGLLHPRVAAVVDLRDLDLVVPGRRVERPRLVQRLGGEQPHATCAVLTRPPLELSQQPPPVALPAGAGGDEHALDLRQVRAERAHAAAG